MIVDGRTRVSDGTATCNVLIVGGGPAGITLAMELEGAGLDVILLESGGLEFDDRAQNLNGGRLTALEETDLEAARLRVFGGASNHWGGHCLPLDPIDFARSPLSGLSGWPVSYDDMVPYYETASRYCELGAFDYGLEGITPLSDRDLLLPGDDRIETKVIRQSSPTNFGEAYLSDLEASETTAVWLWTTATGIEIDSGGTASDVLVRDIEGGAGRITADTVVMAGGAVENARFLLANNARLGQNYGNQAGFLGACYMDHPVGGAAFLNFEKPVSEKAYWSHDLAAADGTDVHLVWRLSDDVLEREALNNIQFFVIPFSDDEAERRLAGEAKRAMRGLKNVVKWTVGRDRETIRLSEEYCAFIQNTDSLAVHTYNDVVYGEQTNRVLLRYESEQRPDRASYVALDDTERDPFGSPRPVLNWSPSLDDRDAIVRSAVLIGQIAGETGLGRVELEDHFDVRYWDATTAWHQMGTTRMAVAESDGVVDENGRLFGTGNVYVTGGSVFPSGGRANPTMTIVALAARLAEHLKKERGA